jgi:hypothetical protein
VRAAVLVIAIASSAAFADSKPEQKNEAPPDENADVESREANLESNAPRKGVVFGLAIGPGVLMGGNVGVGRGGALSLRLGHVATRSSVITFEIVGTGAQHSIATNDPAVTDTNVGLFAGIQTYISRATWLRLSGGPTVFSANIGGSNQHQNGGVGGLAGAGFDIARWGYLVLDISAFGMTSLTSDGGKVQLGFVLGLTYY